MKRNAQSLSICVPGKQCVNRCAFCVSCMHSDTYRNQMDENLPFYDLYFEDYVKRMIFAKENDANIMMITGNIEPLQNRHFLQTLSIINKYVLPQKGCSGFNWIEIQTSAVGFDRPYARFLRNTVGVSVFSFSLVKEYDFTLRLSLNINTAMLESVDGYNDTKKIESIFAKALELGADQLTFRKLYTTGENEQSEWIMQNTVPDSFFDTLNRYIVKHGKFIGRLPYGYSQYSVNGISVVVDEDCMNEEKVNKEVSKYFVLRPDCKLYDGWNKEDVIF